MTQQSPEEMQDVLFSMSETYNFSLIIKFHNQLLAGMKAKVAEIDTLQATATDQQERDTLQCHRAIYTETFDPMLRLTTFLLMYAHLEEWLFLMWDHDAPGYEVKPGERGLQRYKRILKTVRGIDMSKNKYWNFLCDAEQLRHCVLHANRRVSLMKNPQKIERIAMKRWNILTIEVDRLQIFGEFLKIFLEAIQAMIVVTRVTSP